MFLTQAKDLWLFDFDGTLVDTSLDILASINHTRVHYGLPALPFAEARHHIGIGQKALVEGILKEQPSIPVEEAVTVYRQHHETHLLDNPQFYPGVRETLTILAAQNKQLGIISNKYSFYITQILQKLNCPVEFGLVLGPDNVTARKPDPAPLQKACAHFKLTPAQSVMLGDSIYDIQLGKNTQTTTIACTYGFADKALLAVENPDYFIDNFSELLLLN